MRARTVVALALLVQAVAACTEPLGGTPSAVFTSPVYPLERAQALAIAKAALEREIRPDLVEPVERPYPGYRGWLRFVVGLDSLSLFVVAGDGADAAGEPRQGFAFWAYYDGSYEAGGQATARAVLEHAMTAAAALAAPLAPLPGPDGD